MKNPKIRKQTVYAIIVQLLLSLLAAFIPFSTSVNNIIAVIVIALSLIWVWKCKNNTYTLILSLFIAYCNYSIAMGVYLDPTLRSNEYLYYQITDPRVYGTGIYMVMLFMLYMVIVTPFIKKSSKQDSILVRKENHLPILFYVNMILMFVSIFTGYEVNLNSRGTTSPLYEYSVIFLIMMFYFSGDRKVKKYFCFFSMIVYSLTSVLNGTRVEALACILIFVLCYYKNELKPWFIMTCMLGGLLLFSSIGVIRGNWSNISSGSFFGILSGIAKNKMVFDTCTYAYFPMLCMIEQFSPYNLFEGIGYFFRFVLSVFLGQSRVQGADLIVAVRENYFHNYGGCTVGFFYTWFYYYGALLFGIIVQKYIKVICSHIKKTDYGKIALTYVVATVGRWYLYGPWAFTRGVLVCSLIYYAMMWMNRSLKRCQKTKHN